MTPGTGSNRKPPIRTTKLQSNVNDHMLNRMGPRGRSRCEITFDFQRATFELQRGLWVRPFRC
jgi:hypothetical protein